VTEFRSNRPTLDRGTPASGHKSNCVNPARAARIELGVEWFETSPVLTTEMPRTARSPDARPARGRPSLLPEQRFF
jgi:hypothetical protein